MTAPNLFYEPVPVRDARQIAENRSKAIVVIVSWDRQYNLIHTTTYGMQPMDKVAAANLGECLAAAAGGQMDQKMNFEDFRVLAAAEAKARIDNLERENALLLEIVSQVKHIQPELLQSVQNDIDRFEQEYFNIGYQVDD